MAGCLSVGGVISVRFIPEGLCSQQKKLTSRRVDVHEQHPDFVDLKPGVELEEFDGREVVGSEVGDASQEDLVNHSFLATSPDADVGVLAGLEIPERWWRRLEFARGSCA